MKKIVLSVIAVLSLLDPALIFVRPTSAATCPVKMPETLLSLYRQSDVIYIGRYNGSEEGKVTHDDDDYTVVEIKKHFDILSALKGKAAKTFTLLDSDYRYKDKKAVVENTDADVGTDEIKEVERVIDARAVVDIEDMDDDEGVSETLKPGDKVLLFLRSDDEGKQLEPTDYRDGVKNLNSDDLAVYEARIKELASLLSAEKPDTEKITEWLIRCAEEPATRWEGAFELDRSFNALDYKNQRDETRRTRIAQGEKIEDEDEYFDEGLETGRTIAFAKSLNAYQKQTLANIILNSDFQAPRPNGRPASGDAELMSLVARWADARIAELYVNRLRAGAHSPQENSRLMSQIASILDDNELTAIADKFGDIYYESDDGEADESDVEAIGDTDDDDEDVVASDVENEISPAREPDAESAKPEPADTSDDNVEAKPAVTYKQLRGDLTAKFLARADEIMANPDARVR